MQEQAPSIADLPPELLRHVFAFVLPSTKPETLLDVAQQWLALQLTCKAWAAALQAEPPIPLAVAASMPPPGSVRWLQRHAVVLHILAANRCSFDDFRGADPGSRMRDWVQRHCGLPHAEALWSPNEYGGPDAAHISCAMHYEHFIFPLLAGYTMVPHGAFKFLPVPAGAPLLALPECSNLEDLHLQSPRVLNPYQPSFNSEVLSKLPRLRRLELVGFGPLYLDALPASLRTLRSFGGQVTEEMMLETEDGAEPFLLTLPDHCRMESAVIVAHFHGVIDLDFVEHFHDPCRIKALLPHTWRACRELELQAEYLLLAEVPADLEVFKVGYDPEVGYDEDASIDEEEVADVSELLSRLADGLGPATTLRRLAVNLDAHFVLPSGQLICAKQLLRPAGVAQAATAGLEVQQWEGSKTECVLLTPRR